MLRVKASSEATGHQIEISGIIGGRLVANGRWVANERLVAYGRWVANGRLVANGRWVANGRFLANWEMGG